MREWPFVLFALAVLLPGLFIERFYCRYLCALGAALAIPARIRMFDWLKRYHDCGQPCQICATELHGRRHPPGGHINPNECHSCMHCQELYHDEQHLPGHDRETQETRAARELEPGLPQSETGRICRPSKSTQRAPA